MKPSRESCSRAMAQKPAQRTKRLLMQDEG
jgi:hypothetical protein